MFNSGFSQYLNSGLFSDITVVVNKKNYNLHKLILVFSSDYFKLFLQSLENPILENGNNSSSLVTTNNNINQKSNVTPINNISLLPPSTSSLNDENTTIDQKQLQPITTILTSTTTTTSSESNLSNLSSSTTSSTTTTTISTTTTSSPLGIGTSRKSFFSNLPPPPISTLTNNNNNNNSNINNTNTNTTNNNIKTTTVSKPLPINDQPSTKTSPSSSWIKSSPNNNLQSPTTSGKRSSSSLTQSFSSLLNSVKPKANIHPLVGGSPIGSPNSPSSQPKSTTSFLITNKNTLKNNNGVQNNNNNPQTTTTTSQDNNSNNIKDNGNYRLSLSSPLSLSSSISSNISPPTPLIQRDGKNNLILEFEIDIINSKIEENRKVFESILEYCYLGQIEITDESAITIFFFSNYFQMLRLKKLTIEYINEHINRKNALLWIEKSIELSINDVIPKCIFVIARNFSQLCESDLNTASNQSTFGFLPVDLFLQILGHPSLSVFSEFTIYQAICKYLESRKHSMNPSPLEEIEELYQHVKFPYLTYHEYLLVTQNPLVPQKLLTEGLLVRLGNFEQPSSDYIQRKLQVPRLMKRKSPARIFEYTGDFDNKGVLYYIATSGYTSEWSNPGLNTTNGSSEINPKIRVTSSSIEKGQASDILELQPPKECWTKDIPSSWYSLDLGSKYSLILKYYTLRHGQNSKNDGLMSWVIQGSDDGLDWYTISRHTNENHFISNFISHSFPVTSSSAYRYFRILQIGHNSSSHNFLALSGFELYGELYE